MLFQGSLLQHLGEHRYLRGRCKPIILFGWEAAEIYAEVLQATGNGSTALRHVSAMPSSSTAWMPLAPSNPKAQCPLEDRYL